MAIKHHIVGSKQKTSIPECPPAPADGTMISPSNQKVIQIEITNTCFMRCSNCTRFVSHVDNPFFMDYRTFQKSVDSLVEFSGCVGIMGGEPTMHPQFDCFIPYYAEKIPQGKVHNKLVKPVDNIGDFRNKFLSDVDHAKRGLWSSLGKYYYRHFELIQDTFEYQCLNDHHNEGLHQALLISRHDLNIPDHIWYPLRDRCWVQRLWSASITPKGAFFCEVAAAMDMLFNGPGGWHIEPGWWKRTPKEFGYQLKWCEYCAAPLNTVRRKAYEKIDDVSKTLYEKLEQVKSPSLKKNRVRVFNLQTLPVISSPNANPEWYLPKSDNSLRISPLNRSVKPRKLVGLTVCVGMSETLQQILCHNIKQLDKLVVVTTSTDKATIQAVQNSSAKIVISDRCYENGDLFNKGKLLNDGLLELRPDDWVLGFDCDIILSPYLKDWVFSKVLNPGCLYYTKRYRIDKKSIPSVLKDWRRVHEFHILHQEADVYPWGYFQLYNVNAQALVGKHPKLYSEVFPTAGSIDNNFMRYWDSSKRINICEENDDLACAHVEHGNWSKQWSNNREPSDNSWIFVGQTYVNNVKFSQVFDISGMEGWVKLVRLDTAEYVIVRWQRINNRAIIYHHDKILNKVYLGIDNRWGITFDGNKQIYVWDNQQIQPVQFDWYYAKKLNDAEQRFVV